MGIEKAEQYESNRQLEEAYAEYIDAYRGNSESPENIEILEKLGQLALTLDKKSEAENWYRKILSSDPKNISALQQLMDLFIDTNKFEYYGAKAIMSGIKKKYNSAICDFKRALCYAKTDEEVWMAKYPLGRWLEALERGPEAIKVYLSLLDSPMLTKDVFSRLANLYVHHGDFNTAIEILHRGIDTGFDEPEIREFLSDIYFQIEDYTKAEEMTHNDLFKIKCVINMKNFQEVKRRLEELQETYYDQATYHGLWGEYYFHQKDFIKFHECIDKYGELDSHSAQFYEMQMLYYMEMNDELNAYINIAKYKLLTGNPITALENFITAFNLKNNDAEVIKSIAVLSEHLGNIPQSIEFYEKLIDLEPDNKESWIKIVELYEKVGDYKSAIAFLEKLYALENNDISVILNLAQMHEKLKNKQKVLEFYNRFLEISPVNNEYELIRQKVEKLTAEKKKKDKN